MSKVRYLALAWRELFNDCFYLATFNLGFRNNLLLSNVSAFKSDTPSELYLFVLRAESFALSFNKTYANL